MAELLAPAGEPEAGYAALAYGADAVYLGLDRFSARAGAVNFTPDDLAEFVGYAHSLAPRRRVYCTLNTLVRDPEFTDAALTLLAAASCGVDAVIVQDAGIAAFIRERFPSLALHASTQMAIHNRDGALAAKALGFRRVTLARELTLREVADIVEAVGAEMEIETFIHGTLCYSYSGLCLFSSMMTGRSGNRGRCVYTCREAADCNGEVAHPFSLKDMALGSRVLDLVKAGVSSLKIEGRKKSPLYVAATVDYYRKLLDGIIGPDQAEEYEARLKTIFARPWTKLFLDSPRNPDAADPQVVGHRGSAIGTIDSLVRTPAGPGIAFIPSMPVERHDGIQVDVPGRSRPFGFPVNSLYTITGRSFSSVFSAAAGTRLAVALPPDAPDLAAGLPLYLSSSQAVKRSYPYSRPKPGLHAPRLSADRSVCIVDCTPDEKEGQARIACEATVTLPAQWHHPGTQPMSLAARIEENVPAFPARDGTGAEAAAQTAFSRLGDSAFTTGSWSFSNPSALFVKQGEWNRLRRQLFEKLTVLVQEKEDAVRADLVAAVNNSVYEPVPSAPEKREWGIAVDSVDDLSALTADDLAAAAEICISIHDGATLLDREKLASFTQAVGLNKVRLAVPLIIRGAMAEHIRAAAESLFAAGFSKWLLPGWAGWQWLAGKSGIDMAADWGMYVFNRRAADEMTGRGFFAFTISPEDDRENMAALLAHAADRAWILAYADIPLFIAAACAHAHLGLCQPKRNSPSLCPAGNNEMTIRMERSGEATIVPQGCGSVVLGSRPYSLVGKVPYLESVGAQRFRVDLRWKKRTPAQNAHIWQTVRRGTFHEGIIGNFERGIV